MQKRAWLEWAQFQFICFFLLLVFRPHLLSSSHNARRSFLLLLLQTKATTRHTHRKLGRLLNEHAGKCNGLARDTAKTICRQVIFPEWSSRARAPRWCRTAGSHRSNSEKSMQTTATQQCERSQNVEGKHVRKNAVAWLLTWTWSSGIEMKIEAGNRERKVN